MPSSMIFVGLVVLWLLILVPAVARHRQEVARPSSAALSGRVLDRPRRRPDMEVDVDSERTGTVDVAEPPDAERPAPAEEYDDDPRPGAGEPDHDEAGEDDRGWERPPPRYRPGRGGFDPEAAAQAARARYTFRQRIVLAMLVTAVVTGVVAAVAVPGLWWPHAAVDLALVGYLVYLRRQVRLEEQGRRRPLPRLVGPPRA